MSKKTKVTKAKSSKSKKSTAKPQTPKRKASTTKAPAKPVAVSTTASPDQVYRPSSMYGVLFAEGSREYIAKDALITKVAELTGKSDKVIGYAFQVLKARNHRSNRGRSALIEENGLVKFVTLKQPSTV